MTKRALAIAAIVAGVLALGPTVATGCGDKFVLIGGGARVNRSKFPSRVLVFMNPASRIPAAEKEFHVEATLAAAKSVLDQTHRHVELILIDDGSTEPLTPLLELQAADPRIRLIDNPARLQAAGKACFVR